MLAQLSTRQYTAQVMPIFGGMVGVSAIAAYYTEVLAPGMYLLGMIATFALILTVRMWRDSALAVPLALLFALAMGATLGPYVHHYAPGLVAQVLATTAVTFGAMAVFGNVTSRDLSGMGAFLMPLLIGMIVASLLNLFFHSPLVYLVVSIIGVGVFAGFTAYDMQAIRRGAMGPIDGAIALYLDFVNLFVNLLAIFGVMGRDND